MASSNSLILLLSSCSLFFVLAVARKEFALEASEQEAHHFHTLQLSSFLPSSVCNPSAIGGKKSGSLEVVHKHGPCSKFTKDTVKPLTVEEIFTHDQSRVDSIRAKLATNPLNKDTLGSKTTLPAKSGSTIGSGNYIVTVGLGTPKKDLSLIFDTGSDLTWTQCQPCARSCYSQQEPIFAPSMSTTYTNISCSSNYCSDLMSATGNTPGCSSSTCYDLSNFTTITIPKITMFWGGNTNVDIAPQGTLYANGVQQVCLAFAPNGDDSDIGIFGNVQQKSIAVVYDVTGGKVGFAPGGCA
ncbi:putative nepenthesin [Helianthus annuus]|nr:putative nepenthesin [Helianthus annuus]KAJ0649550.1 putative nepenthesin [Helianthus annuus]